MICGCVDKMNGTAHDVAHDYETSEVSFVNWFFVAYPQQTI